jgi:hypothetical protein
MNKEPLFTFYYVWTAILTFFAINLTSIIGQCLFDEKTWVIPFALGGFFVLVIRKKSSSSENQQK